MNTSTNLLADFFVSQTVREGSKSRIATDVHAENVHKRIDTVEFRRKLIETHRKKTKRLAYVEDYIKELEDVDDPSTNRRHSDLCGERKRLMRGIKGLETYFPVGLDKALDNAEAALNNYTIFPERKNHVNRQGPRHTR